MFLPCIIIQGKAAEVTIYLILSQSVFAVGNGQDLMSLAGIYHRHHEHQFLQLLKWR